MSETIEYQAGSVLVHDGIEFKVPFAFGKKITLNIKPCLPGTNIRISKKISQLEKVDIENPTIQEFMQSGNNILKIAEIISIAIINQRFYKKILYRFYRWLMLNRAENMEYLYHYFQIVQRQMGAVFFYRIMELTPAMNYLKKRAQESSEEEKPSGEQSPSSKKHSD